MPRPISTSPKSWLLVLSINRSFSGDFFSSLFSLYFFPLNGATWKDLLLLLTLCIHHIPAEYSFSCLGSLRPNIELEACKKRLEPAGYCQGELEAVLARRGDEEIPTAPWGQVNPGRSITRRQQLTPRCPAHGKEQGQGGCDNGAA